jgi:LacI family transcriptional regulator
MKDVAREAGYSQAAVSLALRNDRSIPEKTRREIVSAAKKLGYRTSPLVAALMSLQRQRRRARDVTTVVAYLTSHPPDFPWRARNVYLSMFAGAEERLAEFGCRLEEFNLRAPGITSARVREILRARGIHGVIVAPLPHGETEMNFDFSRLAAVGLGMSVRSPVIEQVSSDHFQSVVLTIERCLALGYRRIGFLISQETSRRLDHRWLGGYRFAVEQYNLEHRLPPLMPELQREIASAIPAWLAAHRPDVVILGNAEYELQVQLPVHVGMVSLGVDTQDGAMTGIFQDYCQLGRVTAEHVVGKLYTNRFEPIDKAHVHMVAGTWAEGITAPGPGRRRPSAAALKAQRLVVY